MDRSRTELFILAVDPTTLYAYWTVSKQKKDLIESYFHRGWRSLPKMIRVYDVDPQTELGEDASPFRDIDMSDFADHWFVTHLMPGKTYCVDYGTRTTDGRFLTVLRSNKVRLPATNDQLELAMELPRGENIRADEQPAWMNLFTGYSLMEKSK